MAAMTPSAIYVTVVVLRIPLHRPLCPLVVGKAAPR